MSRGPRPSAVKFDAGLTVAGLSAPTVFNVSPDQIQVRPDFNPRGQHTPVADAFSEPALRALGESMRRDGVLTPLIVSQAAEGTYWLIAGERRLRAARLAGLTTLPVMLKTEQDAARLALVENLQRQNLNPVDETFGVFRLLSLETGLAPNELPAALRAALREPGKDPHDLAARLESYGATSLEAWARHRPAFLKMTPGELAAVREGRLPWRTAAELTRLPEGEDRTALLRQAETDDLSTAQVGRRVRELQGSDAFALRARQLLSEIKPARLTALSPERREQAERLLTELADLLRS
ncbi:ParB/RepB/Spo0J family partition protein [uncultured Deinococcus sp.]|uniref:ParB/RepB/Spo0J family partition protein n=1 Tax=uncultured Deinococcus sp. TaxID=158789 RepID=UPI0025900483|nr:ParB/RepB/Spo0J family partition protein [uncultured Deinococcus sp.]